ERCPTMRQASIGVASVTTVRVASTRRFFHANTTPPTHLLSFPTRRSSDLDAAHRGRARPACRAGRRCRQDDEEGRHEEVRGRRRSEEHTSELQSPYDLVCRLLLEKKKC